MRTGVRAGVAAIAANAAVAVGGCGASEGDGAAAAGASTVEFVTPYKVKSLDPIQQGLWSPEWGYGELLMRANDDGSLEPWLLDGLDRVTPTEWRLTLRPGVTFANGHPLDAATLEQVIDRHLADNPLAQSQLPGADAEAVDDRTVTLTTAAPVGNLPNLLADEQLISVFDPAVATADADPATLVGKGIYTGPFTVASLTADEMVLEANPAYWGGDVVLDGARVRFVPDAQARIRAVQNAEADIALYPPTELLAPFADATSGPRLVTATQPMQQLRAIPNVRQGPMAETAVRRAFGLGIDYAEIAEDVLGAQYTVPHGLYPEELAFAVETQRTDPAEAKQLLDGAGWAAGADGVRVKGGTPLALTVLTYPQQPDTKTIAVAIQAQLKKIGIDVEIREVEDNYEAMGEPAGWDVGLSFDGTLGYTFDPVAPLRDFLTSDAPKNFGGVADPALDVLVTELAATDGERARTPVLADIQSVIADNGYLVIVAQRAPCAVVGDDFAGYRPSSVLHHLDATTAAG